MASTPQNFSWSPGGAFPYAEQHSLRKLEVLKNYLDVYFDTVVPNPATDCLNITLVDGFCGGGAYSVDGKNEFGSPIILLRAVQEAEIRLNEGRAKPLKINARFVFIDSNLEHIQVLRQVLIDNGFGDQIGENIDLVAGEFAEELPKTIENILRTQRKGRSIFVLDQFGYSDVPMSAIQRIFNNLERPEVILTFAIDSLLNYLSDDSTNLELYRQFGVDERFLTEWQANKNDAAFGRLVTQRALMSHIHRHSGAEFFTPFLLWSRNDNRWMMLAHLSRHQAARDKMLGVHWDTQNTFKHIGKGSLFALGFDPRAIEDRDSLFSFSELDRETLSRELLNELPSEVYSLMTDDHVQVAKLLEQIGNRTAATNDTLFAALMEMARSRELEVVSERGAQKRPGSRIILTDKLIRPSQRTLFKL